MMPELDSDLKKRQRKSEVHTYSKKNHSLAETLIVNFNSLGDDIKSRLLSIVDNHLLEDPSLL